MVKNRPAMQDTWVHSLSWEDPLEKGTATYSSILAWRIPWTEEPGRKYSMRDWKSQSRLSDFHFTLCCEATKLTHCNEQPMQPKTNLKIALIRLQLSQVQTLWVLLYLPRKPFPPSPNSYFALKPQLLPPPWKSFPTSPHLDGFTISPIFAFPEHLSQWTLIVHLLSYLLLPRCELLKMTVTVITESIIFL